MPRKPNESFADLFAEMTKAQMQSPAKRAAILETALKALIIDGSEQGYAGQLRVSAAGLIRASATAAGLSMELDRDTGETILTLDKDVERNQATDPSMAAEQAEARIAGAAL
jgi:hypothetical protein